MRQLQRMSSLQVYLAAACLAAAGLTLAARPAAAGQGCPFDDGACQEYCAGQSCNLGYCGHFAWIQCICRKCGDEWNSYDKLRLSPGSKVNQTELGLLKLNVSSTEEPAAATSEAPAAGQANETRAKAKPASTLTLLLVPDLSGDNGKLEDVPEESSDKFLDYLANNHERLVQATRHRAPAGQPAEEARSGAAEAKEPAGEEQADGSESANDDDVIEIQVSSSANNSNSTGAAQLRVPAAPGEPEAPAASSTPA